MQVLANFGHSCAVLPSSLQPVNQIQCPLREQVNPQTCTQRHILVLTGTHGSGQDIATARECFIMSTELHLIFLVTPLVDTLLPRKDWGREFCKIYDRQPVDPQTHTAYAQDALSAN